jgi:hypothetical protein
LVTRGGISLTLSTVSGALLVSPLAVELPCLCISSLSQLSHWEYFSWRLLGRSCWPIQLPKHTHMYTQVLQPSLYIIAEAAHMEYAAHTPPRLLPLRSWSLCFTTVCVRAPWLTRLVFQPTLRSGPGSVPHIGLRGWAAGSHKTAVGLEARPNCVKHPRSSVPVAAHSTSLR